MRIRPFLWLALLFIGLVIVNQFQPPAKRVNNPKEVQGVKTIAPEIGEIRTRNNLDQQVLVYKRLIERVGPKEAQDQLQASGLPFDGQSHLLNHTVGDYLYEKYGSSGLSFCKDYFLSSCYHGFVIRAVADGGFEALKEVMKTCWEKGYHVAVQCSHAIGHGFLAWNGYANLNSALKDCDRLSQDSPNFPLYNCHDGVFMENIWAVHEDGKPSKERWVKDDDPIYPCNNPGIDEKYINACWSNQPMRMYQMFGGNIVAVASECYKLANSTYKLTCFDGLARQIHPETKGSVDETIRMCQLMPQEWINACIISIARAYFSVGDREKPFEICARIDLKTQEACEQTLKDIILGYTKPLSNDRDKLCRKLNHQNPKNSCLKTI